MMEMRYPVVVDVVRDVPRSKEKVITPDTTKERRVLTCGIYPIRINAIKPMRISVATTLTIGFA